MKEPVGRHLALVGLVFHGLTALAQDLIQWTGGANVEVRVLEIKGTQFFYKKFAQSDGLTYVISTESVQQITYQDGSWQQFDNPLLRLVSSRPKAAVNEGRQRVAVRPLGLLFSNLTLTYEHLSQSARLGFKVPLFSGIGHQMVRENHRSFYYQYNKVFSTGLELNFYGSIPWSLPSFRGASSPVGAFAVPIIPAVLDA